LADVDAVDRDAAACQFVGVAAGAAADIEHPLARPQAQRGDDVVDLLDGALGVGVPVVGRTEVIGEFLEPVVASVTSTSCQRSGASWARSSA
jgi:hypothetical protein